MNIDDGIGAASAAAKGMGSSEPTGLGAYTPAMSNVSALGPGTLAPTALGPAALDPAALDPAALQGLATALLQNAPPSLTTSQPLLASALSQASVWAAQAVRSPHALSPSDAQLDALVQSLAAATGLEAGRTWPAELDVASVMGNASTAPLNLSALDLISSPTPVAPSTGVPSAFAPSVEAIPTSSSVFDANSVKRDFPILEERINGKPLVWLDNAATTQKPSAVIDRISEFYRRENSNIHRAAHTLAARATDAYEGARESVRRFLNAPSARNIVFVRGATEAINFVAQSWARRHLSAGDEVVISWLEHHSNIVPWQLVCAERGATLKVAPVNDRGEVLLDSYERLLNSKTKLVSLTHVSNALGTVLPVRVMTQMAHRVGARVLIDGAQAVSHLPVDVQAIDCDWYVFSGHKVFAPTGIGAVYGKTDALESSPPWQGGGNMIADVTFEKTLYHPPPMRFEAGTGNIADAVGLGAALDYLTALGMPNVERHEHDLMEYGIRQLSDIPGLRLVGTAAEKAGVMSFVLAGFTTEEVGRALNEDGIAVRAGHHCAQPALRRMGLETAVRPSLAVYNTCADIDALIASLRRLMAKRGAGTRR